PSGTRAAPPVRIRPRIAWVDRLARCRLVWLRGTPRGSRRMSYIPMMGGRWRAMSGVQSARFRQHLDTACATPGGPALGGAILGPVRYLVLSCYPGWVLIEADLAAGAGEIATVNLM